MAMPWTKNGKLLKAAKNGNVKRVAELLQAGADPNTKDAADRYVLVHASARGNAAILKALLEAGSDPNVKGMNNHTALMASDSIEIVELLLKAGADPNSKNNDGWTALMIASSDGNAAIVRILLKYKANPNVKDDLDRDSLGLAIHSGHTEIVPLLLEAGANPNSSSKNRTTPLIMAAADGRIDIIKMLLDAGANPIARDMNGKCAKDFAKALGHNEIAEILDDQKVTLNNSDINEIIESFKRQIICQENQLFGITLYNEIILKTYGKNSDIGNSNYNAYVNIMQRCQECILKAKQILEDDVADKIRVEKIAEFEFPKIEGNPMLDALTKRANLLVKAYEKLFPKRPKEYPLSEEEFFLLQEEALRNF